MIKKVTVPEGVSGAWRVERFTPDVPDWHAHLHGRDVPVGEEFTRLMRGRVLVMSDTPAERIDHFQAVRMASGSCLINGLGLGVVLQAILDKPDVTDVTVVEISQDVLNLVAPHYRDSRVQYIQADAMEYRPPKGKRYQMVWHDIWDYVCADNLRQMHVLHKRYGRRTDWQGSWCRKECEDALKRAWRSRP